MRAMILFQLKKKYLQKQTLVKMGIIFLIIGILSFLDLIVPIFVTPNIITVSLDKSVIQYQPYLTNNNNIKFSIDETNSDYLLINDNSWIIKGEQELSIELKEELISMVNEAISKKEGHLIDDIETQIIGIKSDDYSIQLIILTIVYFTCLSKTSTLVQGLVEEKHTGLITMYLCTLKSWKHLVGKILISWISSAIDIFYYLFSFLCWISIRIILDEAEGLLQMVTTNVSLEGTNTIIQIEELLAFILVLLVGIITIQTIVMVYAAKIKSVDEIGNSLIPIHLLMMGNYYLCFYLYDVNLLSTNLVKFFSYLPVVNTILLPMRILKEMVSLSEITLFIASSVGWLFFIVTKGQKMYKRRLLGIKKLRHFNLRS